MESLLVEVKAETKTKLYTISLGIFWSLVTEPQFELLVGIRGCNWATDTKEAETSTLPAPSPNRLCFPL